MSSKSSLPKYAKGSRSFRSGVAIHGNERISRQRVAPDPEPSLSSAVIFGKTSPVKRRSTYAQIVPSSTRSRSSSPNKQRRLDASALEAPSGSENDAGSSDVFDAGLHDALEAWEIPMEDQSYSTNPNHWESFRPNNLTFF